MEGNTLSKQEKEDLYFEWEPYIHGVLYEFMSKNKIDYQLTEDLRQDLCIHFYDFIDSYDEEKSQIQTYIYNRVYQYLLDTFRTKFSHNRLDNKYATEYEHMYDPVYKDPDDLFEFECLLETAELTDKQVRCLKLKYIGGLTDKEIAKKEGCKRSAVTRVIVRALDKLRECNIN